ncbi:hypothetical protein OG864_48930 [Streptomyces sp. NBC_00124]|uniref:hypothetical protein n=1 Tax=Streptomyces sp. NBC_00124 TaxID=2975662 RepID=UPI002259A436|nr:hypothetical protein [Streptomyces sp. NBC_00124]MCX5366624.1 hypothetical protein [Streptomyces sp. NBC_00124]
MSAHGLFQKQWPALLHVLDVEINSRPARELLQTVRQFPDAPHKLRLASGIEGSLDAVPC